MRYVFLLALLTVFNLSAFSQRLISNGVDKYTDRFVKETNSLPLTTKGTEAISVAGTSTDNSLALKLDVRLKSGFTINKGDKLYLLFSNGDKVVLESAATVTAEKTGNLYQGIFTYNLDYLSSQELTKGLIVGVRLYTAGDKYIEFDAIKADDHDAVRRIIKVLKG